MDQGFPLAYSSDMEHGFQTKLSPGTQNEGGLEGRGKEEQICFQHH